MGYRIFFQVNLVYINKTQEEGLCDTYIKNIKFSVCLRRKIDFFVKSLKKSKNI